MKETITLPREVVERALESIGSFVSDHGWAQSDMDTLDALIALTKQVQPCIGKDPLCPCQDGDACHYKDAGDTKAWPVKVERVTLSDEKIQSIYISTYNLGQYGRNFENAFARAIEAEITKGQQ